MNQMKKFPEYGPKMEDPDFMGHLAGDIICGLDENATLGSIENSEIMSESTLFNDENTSTGDDNDLEDIMVMYMDIREPLSSLRIQLEERLGLGSLVNYEFWLQNAQSLQPHKNLVDQCVQGEGLVQINCQVMTTVNKINIVDVLKPTDDILLDTKVETPVKTTPTVKKDKEVPLKVEERAKELTFVKQEVEIEEDEADFSDEAVPQEVKSDPKPKIANHWAIDNQFKRDQQRLKIPDNPADWSEAEVKHWILWAVRQFNLALINPSDWSISGKQLCEVTLEEFKQKVPHDPADLFWTHLELLRKCKFVAVLQKHPPNLNPAAKFKSEHKNERPINKEPTVLKTQNRSSKPVKMMSDVFSSTRAGNNGQIQLWQFLLEILTDFNYQTIIQWISYDGEFKLLDPEKVARLWGLRKNKPTMNYEKLSRALRYYYDGDMISKVHNKRFVYKFVCNLQQLIGYNAKELALLVAGQL